MPAVEVKNLVKRYGKVEAVKGVSFSVEENEIFGLIGPNGAGKTTILRILATLIKKDDGKVKIFGYELEKNDDEIRKIISYLPEEAGAYKNMTGYQYLTFIAKFFDGKDMVEEGIKISKLGRRINDKIENYSKGMIRRLLLARALMTKPKLAILDEPTAGLDVINAHEIRNIIKEFAKKGTTFLISSHNMLEVEYICDRIALINEGKIIEIDTPSNLKKKYDAKNIEEVFVKVVK
ncbi:MAG TPA: ABC transporter ATP-binding protein [Thermoplasmatales archaeon]|nr:ABC transporter ATP-binding protein [Thermoplasmatales archaeon]